jgi:hypothetical protein
MRLESIPARRLTAITLVLAAACGDSGGDPASTADGGALADAGALVDGSAVSDAGSLTDAVVVDGGADAGCPVAVAVPSAAMGSHFDPAIFDASYYLCRYPDLAAAGIVDAAAARMHWLAHGMAEGRVGTPGFSVIEYLAQYPDLQAAFGTAYGPAFLHYVHDGIREGRRGTIANTPNPAASVGTSLRPTASPSYDLNARAHGALVDLGSSARMAGGLDYLLFGAKQLINTWDHGRELQIAWSFDGHGEAENPTECGSSQDGVGATSSSVLSAFWTSGALLGSEVRPAYWNAPGQNGAVNTTIAANQVLNKIVEIGYGGDAHVLRFLMQLTLPEHHTSLTLEAPTGYLTGDFTAFYTFDLATGTLAPLSVGPGEQGKPVILATPSGAFAMSAWSPDLPAGSSGYGRFAFPDAVTPANATNKWNLVFRRADTPSGIYDYRSFVFVGTLAEVQASMLALYAKAP